MLSKKNLQCKLKFSSANSSSARRTRKEKPARRTRKEKPARRTRKEKQAKQTKNNKKNLQRGGGCGGGAAVCLSLEATTHWALTAIPLLRSSRTEESPSARGSPHASASLQGDLNGKAPGLRGIALRCASVLRLVRERKVAKHSWTSDAASSLKQQGDLPPMSTVLFRVCLQKKSSPVRDAHPSIEKPTVLQLRGTQVMDWEICDIYFATFSEKYVIYIICKWEKVAKSYKNERYIVWTKKGKKKLEI